LTDYSLEVINADTMEKKMELIQEYRQSPLSRPNMATCLATIKKQQEDEYAISMAVAGTEYGEVLIFDPTGTTVLKKVHPIKSKLIVISIT
jgi:hypothetical protein